MPAPKRELTKEERITVSLGGTAPPTAAPGGIAGTGVTALEQEKDAPPPPPATWDAYAKKSQESNGVMAMIDMLAADLDKEIEEMRFEEKDASRSTSSSSLTRQRSVQQTPNLSRRRWVLRRVPRLSSRRWRRRRQ